MIFVHLQSHNLLYSNSTPMILMVFWKKIIGFSVRIFFMNFWNTSKNAVTVYIFSLCFVFPNSPISKFAIKKTKNSVFLLYLLADFNYSRGVFYQILRLICRLLITLSKIYRVQFTALNSTQSKTSFYKEWESQEESWFSDG